MKNFKWQKAAAVVLTIALALVITGVPKSALANVTAVSSLGPQTIGVGGSVTIAPTLTTGGTLTTNPTYTWTVSPSGIVTPTTSTASSVTFTGVAVGTATVSVTVQDDGDRATLPTALPGATQTYTIYVSSPSVSLSPTTIAPSSTSTATASNFVGTVTSWASGNSSVATVTYTAGSPTATVTAVGSGSTTITATNTLPSGAIQQSSATITVPTVTLSPATSTLSAASTPTMLTLSVSGGGTLIPTGTAVTWLSTVDTIGALTEATTVNSSGLATVKFTSSAAGINGTTTIYATVGGITRSATVTVSTARRLDIVGTNDLNKTTRTATYTVYLKNPDGTVYNDSTSTVHWDWSKSYLSLTSDSINDNRAVMHNGEAHIQLYAKYNTPSGGTQLRAWINSDTGGTVYHTIYITGLSSLPQTGQDMTLVYLFGGTAGALLIAAGVWYGIRKKRIAA